MDSLAIEDELDDEEIAKMNLIHIRKTTEAFRQEKFDESYSKVDEVVRKATGGELTAIVPEGRDLPDEPPCDGCGKPFSGIYTCSKCSMVNYCSPECQKQDWKDEHKDQCNDCIEMCYAQGHVFHSYLSDPKLPMLDKLVIKLWTSVDKPAPYKVAADLGVNEVLYNLVREDIVHTVKRFREENFFGSYTEHMTSILFRGGRCNPGYSHVDAYRIKKFLSCKPDAYEKWFYSCMNMVHIFLTHGYEARDIRGDDNYFWRTHHLARDMVSSWCLIFTSTKSSKAIILGESGEPDEAAHDRARWTLRQCKRIYDIIQQREIPDQGVIEGQTETMIASIEYRLNQFDVDIGDVCEIMGMKGFKKGSYLDMHHTFAEYQIKKGRSLNITESAAALQEYHEGGISRSRDYKQRALDQKAGKFVNRKKQKQKGKKKKKNRKS